MMGDGQRERRDLFFRERAQRAVMSLLNVGRFER